MNVKRGATKKRGIMKKRGSRHLLISSSLIVLIFLGLIAIFYFSGLSNKFTFTGFAVQEGANTALVTINASKEIGIVRGDFYGVGLQSPKLVSGTITLPNGTKIKRNYTWQQQAYLNNGAKISYYDAALQNYYGGLYNHGFEDWTNESIKYINDTITSAYARFITIGGSGTEKTGYVYATNDSHTGDHAYQINSTIGSTASSWFSYVPLNVKTGNTYNLSVWLKGRGDIILSILNSNYIRQNYTIITLTNDWTLYSLTCTPNVDNQYMFVFAEEVNNLDNVTIDDYNITENGNAVTWWRMGNTSDFENQLTWDYQNNITSMIIMDYMPSFLANYSFNFSGVSNCLDNLSDTDYGDCGPYDYDIFAEISLDFYKRVDQYRNNTIIQIWNEPEGGFFEGNLPASSAKSDFVILFNSTYNALKDYNKNIIIAGYRGTANSVTTNSISNFTRMMLSNLSDKFDIFSYHPYSTAYIGYPSVSSEVDYLLNQCKIYGANCSRIFLTEWQPTNQSLKNQSNGQSNEYEANIAYFLQDLLNGNKSSIVSQFPYHWDDTFSYFNSPENYPEYPSFWSSVSEAGLDNPTPTYYPVYNVTKDFAHYHSAGSRIINSSSSNKNISVVVSKNNEGVLHITIININKNNISVNVNLSSTGAEAIKDLATGQVYNVESGIASVGILEPYDVKHYENCSKVVEENNPAPSSSSENSVKKKVIKENETAVLNNNSAEDIKNEISKNSGVLSEENNISNSNDYNAPISGGATLDLGLEDSPKYIYIIILTISIIGLGVLIYVVSKRKKRVKKLDDWVNRAFSLGYNSKQIQQMLEKSSYNKKLVEKIIRRYT